MLAVVFSASLFSCGSSDKAAEATDTLNAVVEDVVAVVEDTVAADSVVTDTIVAEAAVVAE